MYMITRPLMHGKQVSVQGNLELVVTAVYEPARRCPQRLNVQKPRSRAWFQLSYSLCTINQQAYRYPTRIFTNRGKFVDDKACQHNMNSLFRWFVIYFREILLSCEGV